MPEPGARTETLHSSPRATVGPELRAGDRLGRFVLERTIGAGGMGTVYAARDPDLDRPVAIKVLHAATGDRARQQRLLTEARAIARLRHPNVVVVHELGEDGGRLFVVMELVDGLSLRDWLAAAPRTLDAKVAVLAGAARGLAHAHAQGIAHRDFKPENVMIDGEGAARVVDFGIAELGSGLRADAPPTGGETQTGDAIGTPPYMAPEQLRGEAATPACDQFGWSVTLYEALVGERPARRPDLAAIAAGASPEPIEVSPAVPARLRGVLTRGLAAAPADRFASMDELVRALEPPAAKRLLAYALAGGGVVLAATAGVLFGMRGDATDTCATSAARLRADWYDDAAARLGASLAGAAPPVVAAVGERATAWRTSHLAICRAAAGPVRAHRMACLDDALAGLRAFVDFWAAPPANVDVTAAGRGSRALADPAACETAVPQPEMPPRTPAEEALFTELAAANVARSAAAFDRTIEIAHGVAEKARAIGSDRVFARARVISGEALGFEQKMDDAERELREAAEAAARGKDDLLAANAWGALIVQIGVHEGKPAEALSLATAARAAVSRTGDDRDAAIRLHLDLARVMVTAGDYAGARAELEPAVAMVDAPPRQPDKLVGEIHSQLAMTLMELGDPVDRDAWVKHLERALEAQRRAYGDSHPAVAQTLQYIAVDKSRNGDPAGALVELERSLAAFAASLGEDQPVYAGALGDKAVALVRLGELDAALPVAERGAEIMTAALGAEHPNTISAWALVGSVLRVKGDAAGAIAVLEKAFAAADPAAPPLELLELARAYADAGRMKDARATIDRAKAAGLDVAGALEEPAAVDER